ncbi:hypothetical protein DdX_16486 [Ditylenchus destructor]|uniref:Uncharacterized protein n=1 Tax=Ditylenchus destructor TaxID=166010 RepID=A0AAD4MQA6_9BILA|nr:hypothetical protein DdX_16486 [Ditylenchus destructor]
MSQEPLNNQSTTVVSYLNTLNFTYDIVILVAHFTSIVLFLRILYFYHFKPHALRISALSKLLYMFLGTHIVLVLATIPYHIYLLLKWTSQANTVNYDPYVLLLLGVWVDCYVNASSAVAYFIMMDRWMALKFPFKYNTFISAWLLKIAILSVIFVCSASIVYGIIEIPLDMDKEPNRQNYNDYGGCSECRSINLHAAIFFFATNTWGRSISSAHLSMLRRSDAQNFRLYQILSAQMLRKKGNAQKSFLSAQMLRISIWHDKTRWEMKRSRLLDLEIESRLLDIQLKKRQIYKSDLEIHSMECELQIPHKFLHITPHCETDTNVTIVNDDFNSEEMFQVEV